jgi:calcineurin-like phosphoesterase family protein
MTGPKTPREANYWYGYWLRQLKGRIIRLQGNHDPRRKGFSGTVIHVGDKYFKLIHDPRYAGDWKGWLIHGHVHNKSPFIDFQHSKINVSVDATGFKPVKLNDILKKIK